MNEAHIGGIVERLTDGRVSSDIYIYIYKRRYTLIESNYENTCSNIDIQGDQHERGQLKVDSTSSVQRTNLIC